MKFWLDFIIIFVFINCLLPGKAFRIRRNAFRDKRLRWPKAVVPYTINEAFSSSEKKVLLKAIKDIESVSCVRFKKHSGEKGYADVVKGAECSAPAGYTGRRQKITLGKGCVNHETVLHELFHTLGFCHEHTRPDRDQYIKINKGNIKREELYNFNKLSSKKFTSFGLPYDYNSVLHYHDKAFAKDRSQKSIKPIRGKPVIGKATGMSKLDVLKLNKLYRCKKSKSGKFYKKKN